MQNESSYLRTSIDFGAAMRGNAGGNEIALPVEHFVDW